MEMSMKYPTTPKLGAWAMIMTLLLGTMCTVTIIPLTGCPLTPTQIENEVNTILQEAAGIIAVADPGVSWLADFTKAANLLKVDEAAWIKGGAVQDVINVLNDLEQVAALISPLVPYASLIGILVAGIDAVLSLLLPTPAVTANVMTAHAPNPWKGRATVTSAKDSKDQWAAAVKTNPALAAAKL
jgi:hypothetical protein